MTNKLSQRGIRRIKFHQERWELMNDLLGIIFGAWCGIAMVFLITRWLILVIFSIALLLMILTYIRKFDPYPKRGHIFRISAFIFFVCALWSISHFSTATIPTALHAPAGILFLTFWFASCESKIYSSESKINITEIPQKINLK